MDWCRIDQDDVVEIFSDKNQITLDYVLRLMDRSNRLEVRGNPTAEDTQLYTAADLTGTAAGEITKFQDPTKIIEAIRKIEKSKFS